MKKKIFYSLNLRRVVLLFALLSSMPAFALAFETFYLSNPIAKKLVAVGFPIKPIGFTSPFKEIAGVQYLYESKPLMDALQGKPDPKFIELLKDGLHFQKFIGHDVFSHAPGDLKHTSIRALSAAYGAWDFPGASDLLGKTIENNQRIDDLFIANELQYIYHALWVTGSVQHVDNMINGIISYTKEEEHGKVLLPVLHNWKLSESTKDKILNFCVNQIFPQTNRQDLTISCIKYLGNAKINHSGANEFLHDMAVSKNSIEAIHALGQIQNPEALKDFKTYLQKRIKSKETAPRANNYTVPMVIALLNQQDKDAEEWLASWLAIGPKETKSRNKDDSPPEIVIYDQASFNMVFKNLAFLTPEGKKIVQPHIQKAYAELSKLAENNYLYEQTLTEAAVGLLQMGDTTGLEEVRRSLEKDNDRIRSYIFRGLGGHINKQYLDVDGIPVGPGNISVEKAGLLLESIQKSLKYIKDHQAKEAAIYSILEIKARMKAAKI